MTGDLRTVSSVCKELPNSTLQPLALPAYGPNFSTLKVGLAVESMKRHMTDEGWQIFQGLEHNGYQLYGYELPNPITNVREILRTPIQTLILQDKREWDVRLGNFREPRARFDQVEALRSRTDIFKLTILKDAHQSNIYHRDSAIEIGCHAWIVYYHPDIVARLAPYVRREHLVRTYHSLDPACVPEFSVRRAGCILSGAVSGAYPLRKRLVDNIRFLPQTTVVKHPGYHRNGCCTPGFLATLNKYKIAICTSSRYGYALRKIVEATACGCRVITDLPTDDVLPEIDSNLYRVPSTIQAPHLSMLIDHLISTYDLEHQKALAQKAIAYYDYKEVCRRLSNDIEALRLKLAPRS